MVGAVERAVRSFVNFEMKAVNFTALLLLQTKTALIEALNEKDKNLLFLRQFLG
jgi:hypothetical protein